MRLLPTLAIERLPDSSLRYVQWQRNDWGRPTAIVSTYQDGDMVSSRTEEFVYDTETERKLLEARGPETNANMVRLMTRQYQYNTNHQVIAFTNALGEVTTCAYHTNRNLSNLVYPHVLRLSAQVDAVGFVTNLTWKDSNSVALASYAISWTNGKIASLTDPRGMTVTNYWDALGRLVGRSYPDGTSISNLYYKLDGTGYAGGTGGTNLLDRTRFKDRLGNWTSLTYNSLRQLTAITNALGLVTHYDWCACGVLDSVTDPLTNTVTFDHDLLGRLTAIHYPGTNRVLHIDWDDASQPTNLWDTLGSVTLTFNHQGLWTGASNAYGLLRHIDYDIRDRPTNLVYAGGLHLTNSYDALDRLRVRGEINTGAQEKFGYTATVPWATSYTNQLNTGTVLLSYDPLGRLTNQVFQGLVTNRFAYSSAGDLLSLTDGKDQQTRWGYDLHGRAVSKTNADNSLAWTNGYNANGWLTAHWTPAKLLTQYGYDAVGNLAHLRQFEKLDC